MSAKNYWFAFAIGVAAGATIALLYAPQTGSETRGNILKGIEEAGNTLSDAGEYLKDQADRLSSNAADAYASAKGKVSDAVDQYGKKIQDVADQYTPKVKDAVDQAKQHLV